MHGGIPSERFIIFNFSLLYTRKLSAQDEEAKKEIYPNSNVFIMK